MKQYCRGLTLIEILLSITILTLILSLFIPQLLQSSRDQAVDKTVAEMNQIVLAARNYYQESRSTSVGLPSTSYWPQTLNDLVSKSYLPAAALCSSWPSATVTTTCKGHQGYVLFPGNGSGQYDTSVPGIAANGLNKGGNFWGISLTLPNAKIAEEVRQKMPFATRCTVSQLRTGNACSATDNSTTVTAIVPRPALWPQQIVSQYAIDGLIQSIGSITMCDDGSSNICNQGNYQTDVTSTITMPTCNTNTTPVLFVYPASFSTYDTDDGTKDYDNTGPGHGPFYPGISLRTTTSANQWVVKARNAADSNNNSRGARRFHVINIDYFTVCAPKGDPNKWDPSNFVGSSSKGVSW